MPKLLTKLSLKGITATVDALNCQRTIAQQVILIRVATMSLP